MILATASLAFAAAAAQPVQAQGDPATEVQATSGPAGEEINNGTNPTLLANTATLTAKHLSLRGDLSTWVFEPVVQIPFGKKNVSFSLKTPVAHGPFDKSFGLGDISVTWTHVVSVNRKGGIAYTAELFLDTASRADLGAGEPMLKLAAFYAKFNGDGSILAPSLVHQFGLGDGIAGKSVSTSTFDLYYVPKLKNPRLFMTFDPAIVRDWRAEKTFGSLAVTFGSSVGKIGRGNLALFIKPQIQIGAQRPANWGFDVGTKVIGF